MKFLLLVLPILSAQASGPEVDWVMVLSEPLRQLSLSSTNLDELNSAVPVCELNPPGSLADRFCADPVAVLCGPENPTQAYDTIFKASKILEEDEKKSGMPPGSAQRISFLNKAAWKRIGIDPKDFSREARKRFSKALEAYPLIDTEFKKRMDNRVHDGSIAYIDSLLKFMPAIYVSFCGIDSQSPNAAISEKDIVICPILLYAALTAYPELKPAEALHRYLLMPLAHETGHSIDNRAYKNHKHTYQLTDGCLTKKREQTSERELQEITSDFWGTTILAAEIEKDHKKNDRDTLVRNYFQKSFIPFFCKLEAVPGMYPSGRDRIRSILKNTKIRTLMGCQPRYLGKKSCDAVRE